MDIFKKHEAFEIEVLERLKNSSLLKPLVFVGGTMLRLCYDLNRYSTDLDFWFVSSVKYNSFLGKIKKTLSSYYEVTDAEVKLHTLLVEVRSPLSPRRLKIEARKGVKKCNYEAKIAFSKYSNKQVLLNVLTLEDAMESKIKAALHRSDIRDFYDIEFLLRLGVDFELPQKALLQLKKKSLSFKDKDFKVVLGSLLDKQEREYYAKNRFDYLSRKINAKISLLQ